MDEYSEVPPVNRLERAAAMFIKVVNEKENMADYLQYLKADFEAGLKEAHERRKMWRGVRNFGLFTLWAVLMGLFGAIMFGPAKAAEIGIHTLTKHEVDHDYNEKNWGLQVQLDNGVMFGGYRNSYSRDSFYIANTWEYGWLKGHLGVVSGYQRKTETTVSTEKFSVKQSNGATATYTYIYKETTTRGSQRGALGPLLAFSIEPDWAVRPKLTVIPGFLFNQPTVYHLLLVAEI